MSLLHGEYRRHNREDIHTPVSMTLEGNALDTTTQDVSECGLSLKKPTSLDLAVGQSVNVTFNRMPNLSVPAKIVRTGDNSIGLELDHFRFSDIDLSTIENTSPLIERIRYRSKRVIWKKVRQMAVLMANTVFRRLLLRLTKPTFLFAVYGNEKDVGTYTTPKTLSMIPPILLAGFIKSRGHRGLMVASKFFEHELAKDSDKVNQYLEQLKDEFSHIKTIALVGRLPNFVMKAGHDIEPPFVDGSMGTRFMIWDAARSMRLIPKYANERTICVLGGAGRIGNKVCEDLTRIYPTVIALDSRYEKDEKVYTPGGTILRTSNTQTLSQSKLYVSLTGHGDVISEFMTYIPEGSLVGDDTHPCISLKVREQLAAIGIEVQKIILSHDEFSMWPRMPAWSNRAIPGCLAEALVLLDQKEADTEDFESFRETAEAIGFKGKLIKPLEE